MYVATTKRKKPEYISPSEDNRSLRRRIYFSSSSSSSSSASGMSSPGVPSPCVNSSPPHVSTQQSIQGVTIPMGASSGTLNGAPQLPPNSDPMIQSIFNAMSNPMFLSAFIPVLSMSLMPMIQQAVQSSVKELVDKITHQEAVINDLQIENYELHDQIARVENGLEELEQYGRRNSLRFHNVKVDDDADTDKIVTELCKSKLEVEITPDDICRSHPVGKTNKNGRRQIICRFRNWKIKNKIYTQKKKLKGDEDKIYVTEDLTKHRQALIDEISSAKRAGKVHSYWTNDGRVFLKLSEGGRKHLMRSIEHLHSIAPPNSNS
ncbi:hypothetical protein FSP39_017470 [Pinctada imbricata]|uniref:Uncharacterized protein n=1 Tax=Pinctada imbricata TaxID=66713 RepID=A0AA88YED2_PINIB|nr:hypothetical protein FSP39_017470 [Pinctada imbricata]